MTYIDMFGEQWLDEEASQVWVCLAHKRFIPCRRDDGCELSSAADDVEKVRRWQGGNHD